MDLQIKPLSPKIGTDIPLPSYATAGSAGLDLRACIDAPVTLGGDFPNAALVPTGIAAAIPPGYVGLVFPRSGLAIKHGVTLSNSVGVIDSDYRGEIGVGLVNLSGVPYTIQPGERIAQMALIPVAQATLAVVEELDETSRGSGGFGSTGKA